MANYPITALTDTNIGRHNDQPPSDPEWTYCDTDVNKGAGGDYIYLGYQRETTQPWVTSWDFIISDDSIPYNNGAPPNSTFQHWTGGDLNKGAGGKFIYQVWNTGESGKPPIAGILVQANREPHPTPVPGWIAINKDLNTGCGASTDSIWPFYQIAAYTDNNWLVLPQAGAIVIVAPSDASSMGTQVVVSRANCPALGVMANEAPLTFDASNNATIDIQEAGQTIALAFQSTTLIVTAEVPLLTPGQITIPVSLYDVDGAQMTIIIQVPGDR